MTKKVYTLYKGKLVPADSIGSIQQDKKPVKASKARNTKKKQQVEKPVVEETVIKESDIIDIDLGDF